MAEQELKIGDEVVIHALDGWNERCGSMAQIGNDGVVAVRLEDGRTARFRRDEFTPQANGIWGFVTSE